METKVLAPFSEIEEGALHRMATALLNLATDPEQTPTLGEALGCLAGVLLVEHDSRKAGGPSLAAIGWDLSTLTENELTAAMRLLALVGVNIAVGDPGAVSWCYAVCESLVGERLRRHAALKNAWDQLGGGGAPH